MSHQPRETTAAGGLPPDLFDTVTLLSLALVIVLLSTAYGLSLKLMPSKSGVSNTLRWLFIWHAFDALIHFVFEGSFLYHCFFSSASVYDLVFGGGRRSGAENTGPVWGMLETHYGWFPDPTGFMNWAQGAQERYHGAQIGSISQDTSLGGKIAHAFAQLWMVYARADRRWAGIDLGVVSLELLTVFIGGPLACWVCWDIVRKNPRANVLMIMLATAELYGGWMTFCPEWLTGSVNLDTSNFMYKWCYLVFFNGLWVVLPIWAIYVAAGEIMDAFRVKEEVVRGKKGN